MELRTIQKEVGEWSKDNFGNNVSKESGSPVVLGHVASLLGICEEVGEFVDSNTVEDRKDSLGDIGIYLLDFCSRSEVDLQEIMEVVGERNTPLDTTAGYGSKMFSALGKLNHVVLKRHQGIRGMLEDEVYGKALHIAVLSFASAWHGVGFYYGYNVVYLTETTWRKVVSKRNWKKNTEDGLNSDEPPASINPYGIGGRFA